MNPYLIIEQFIAKDDALYSILVTHSQQVAELAVKIAESHPELNLDIPFIKEAALLHDIGIVQCDAPGIACFGTHAYIEHGYLGAEMLRSIDLPRHALVCERHTGTGLTKAQISANKWHLPLRDMCPQSLEEQVICYADKFFSKTHLNTCLSVEHILNKMAPFGVEGELQFRKWMQIFS